MAPDVFVTGVGLCCSLGKTAADVAAAYRTNIPNFIKANDMVGVDGLAPTLAPVIPVAECRDYSERLYRLLNVALDDLRRGEPASGSIVSIHIVLPLWLEGQTMRNEVAGLVMHAFGSASPRATLVFGGPTAYFAVVETAANNLQPGMTAIVGAVDSYMQTSLLDALALHGRMLHRDNPHGSVPSEAAALVTLTRPADGGGTGVGRLLGVIRGHEAENVVAPEAAVGRGLAKVMRQAAQLEDSGPRTGRMMVGLTGERWRAEEFGFAVSANAAVYGDLAVDIEAPLAFTGDCGCASGATMMALALADGAKGLTSEKPVLLLIDSSRAGERAACLVERMEAVA